MKLISINNFILEFSPKEWSATKRLNKIIGYTEFLNQPLKLEMFVPCNENDEKLEYPTCKWCFTGSPNDCHRSKECAIDETPFYNYEKSIENIIFKNYTLFGENDYKWIFINNHKKIEIPKNVYVEFLINQGFDTELTEFAYERIFG